MRRKSVVGGIVDRSFTVVVVEVELVKERNVCTRKVPFAVTEVVPIVPRENIGSLSLFVGRRSIRYLEGKRSFPWKSNGRLIVERRREREKKKKKKEEKWEKPCEAWPPRFTPRSNESFTYGFAIHGTMFSPCVQLRIIFQLNCSFSYDSCYV